MEEIIKSTLLEFDKSTFLIDLTRHSSGDKFINIQQTIIGREGKQQIKINPSILSDIIAVLSIYKKEFDQKLKGKNYFSEETQQSISNIYLKGISTKDLALQFDCSKQIIEQILFNKGIEIVDHKMPKHFRSPRNRRKK